MLRLLIKDSAFYGVLNVVGKSIAFLSFFLYVNYFEKAQIGVIEPFISFQMLLIVVMSCQLESGYVRYYFAEKKNNLLDSLLISILLYLTLTGVVVFVFVSFVIEPFLLSGIYVDDKQEILNLVYLYAFLINFYNVINLKFRYDENKEAFLVYSLMLPVLTLSFIWFFIVYQDGSIKDLFLAYTLALAISLAFQLTHVFSKLTIQNVTLLSWRPIFKYSLPFLPIVFVVTGNEKLLVFLFNEFWEPEKIADYAVALRLAAILGVALGALKMACDTHVNRYISNPVGGGLSIVNLLNNYLVLSFSVFILFLVGAPIVNVLFLASRYSESIAVAYFLGVSLVLLNMIMFTSPGFCIENKTVYKFYISIAQFVLVFSGVYFLLVSSVSAKIIFIYVSFVSFIGLIINTIWSGKLHKINVSYLKLCFVYMSLLILAFIAGEIIKSN